jgi:4-hydroxy-tetrahydrodipicolinate synthase
MESKLVLGGVIPANLMAFDANLKIDERNYRRHIRYLIDTPGVTGLTTNAHASEVATLTLEEQQRSLDITLDEVTGKVPVISGVYEDGTHKAAQIAKMRIVFWCSPRRFSTSATSSVPRWRTSTSPR